MEDMGEFPWGARVNFQPRLTWGAAVSGRGALKEGEKVTWEQSSTRRSLGISAVVAIMLELL